MNDVLALLGLLTLTGLAGHLARLVVRDGYGTNGPPRSHLAEAGSWIDRELGR